MLIHVAGQLQCHLSAVTPCQPNNQPSQSPDISMLSPELQQQWHVSRNMHLGAVKLKPHSRIKAVWMCNMCPAGQPHVWQTTVEHRTRGPKCPYCSNKRLCLHNSLATIAPEVAHYWDSAKNQKPAEQVLAGSFKAAWTCPDCKHEWQARTGSHVHYRAGCPSAVVTAKSQSPSPPLLKLSLQNWLSGITNEIMRLGLTHNSSRSAATSRCTGSAHAVQEGSHTAGQPRHIIA